MYELSWYGKLLLAIPVTLLIIIVSAAYWNASVAPFFKKHKMIKMELHRSGKSNKEYWRRKLYKNYLRLIPFVNCVMERKKKRRVYHRIRRRHRRHHRHHRH